MQTSTKKAIATMMKETGHAVNAEDFDLIEQLDSIAVGFSGITQKERRIISQPFDVCGVKFYPLTVAKSLWFAEKCAAWDVEDLEQEGLLFWLLTLPLNSEVLDEYSDNRKANKAAKKLSRKLHCTPDRLSEVYKSCIGIQEDSDGESSGDTKEKTVDYGGIVAALIRDYGGDPDQWLYETSIDIVSELFAQSNARAIAQETSTPSTGKAVAPVNSARIAALAKFRAKVNDIRKEWSK